MWLDICSYVSKWLRDKATDAMKSSPPRAAAVLGALFLYRWTSYHSDMGYDLSTRQVFHAVANALVAAGHWPAGVGKEELEKLRRTYNADLWLLLADGVGDKRRDAV
jgi:hypothetical protein